MRLVDVVLDQYAWDTISCGCGGSARHIPVMVRGLLDDNTEHEGKDLHLDSLDDHVLTPAGDLVEASAAFVPIALAALHLPLSEPQRRAFLGWLLRIISTAGADRSSDVGPSAVIEACLCEARQGVWSLYAEVVDGASAGSASYAFELLMWLERDRERLRSVQRLARDGLSWELRGEEIWAEFE